ACRSSINSRSAPCRASQRVMGMLGQAPCKRGTIVTVVAGSAPQATQLRRLDDAQAVALFQGQAPERAGQYAGLAGLQVAGQVAQQWRSQAFGQTRAGALADQ